MATTLPHTAMTARTRQLVLLGAGDTHLALLLQLARRPMPGLEVLLVTPYDPVFYAPRLPAFVAGAMTAAQCSISLQQVVRRAGVRWLARRATALDADQRTLLLDNGDALGFDLLSLNTGLIQSRGEAELALPGAREHGLFLLSHESFAALWPRVLALPSGSLRSIAVVGAGAAGVQVALAVRQRLPHLAVTLIANGSGVLGDYPMAMRNAVLGALKNQSITVLPQRATRLVAGEVHLEGGARLACDVPVLALPGQLALWLAQSALAITAQRQVAIDTCSRSTSHPHVFASGDLSGGNSGQRPRTPIHAQQVARALLHNLARVASGAAPKPVPQKRTPWSLLSAGPHQAFACRGNFVLHGVPVALAKGWMERRFVASLRQTGLDNTLT